MKSGRLLSRCWYYFRVGYGTYLIFLVGYGSTLVTIYYLAIQSIPELQGLFRSFWLFAALATITGAPASVFVGWIHTKKSNLAKAEFDISVEANPYNYRLAPGYWREAAFPAYLETLRLLKELSERANLLSDQDKARIETLETKINILVEGGYVGVPRRKNM
jgi:hypothetical protein